MYECVITELCQAYDREADKRDGQEMGGWKSDERQQFLALLQQEGKTSLLEIGSGPGRDSLFFQQQGLRVTCTDLSPEMVKRCQQKGLNAYVMDFLSLDFPAGAFDAVYALNCLLHVPNQSLPAVLERIQALLKPGGLFYLGVYGGIEREGAWPEDDHEPKRFFSYRTDEQIQAMVRPYFQVLSFKRILLDDRSGLHFQLLILRRLY